MFFKVKVDDFDVVDRISNQNVMVLKEDLIVELQLSIVNLLVGEGSIKQDVSIIMEVFVVELQLVIKEFLVVELQV